MTKKILLPLLLLVAGLFLYNFFLKPPSFENGASVPDLEGRLIDGSKFNLNDLKGSYVLLDFWGSWCPPCRKEIPDLKALYKKHHGKKYNNAADFEVVSIALEKSDKYTLKIIESEGLIWPHHIIDINPVVMLSSYAQNYDVKDLPTKFLINPEGKFMGTNLSWEEMDRILTERRK